MNVLTIVTVVYYTTVSSVVICCISCIPREHSLVVCISFRKHLIFPSLMRFIWALRSHVIVDTVGITANYQIIFFRKWKLSYSDKEWFRSVLPSLWHRSAQKFQSFTEVPEWNLANKERYCLSPNLTKYFQLRKVHSEPLKSLKIV